MIPSTEAGRAQPGEQEKRATQQVRLTIGGMRCAACAQLIELRVRQMKGVAQFRINSVSHSATLRFDPEQTSLRVLMEAVAALGYLALPAGEKIVDNENKMRLWRLFVAGFAMMQIMMYAYPSYLVPVPSAGGELTPDIDYLLKLASFLLSIPVVLFSATPFFRSALRDVRNRHVGMDVPVSVGIVVTFVASIWALFAGKTVYFDSLAMFVFFLLLARMIEFRVQQKSTQALRAVTALIPLSAQRLKAYPAREMEKICATELKVNDVVLIAAGEQISADGVVLEGEGLCNEALMTGEAEPVLKKVGEHLTGGAINLDAPLVMRVTAIGDETQLSALIRMMESAADEKPPLVQLADRHASRFLTAILAIALLTVLIWWQIDASRAIWIAVSVLVVTCPCALSLATPGVMSALMGLLARNGVLVARGRAIEALTHATHFVFDKTGTLTRGMPRVSAIRFAQEDQAAQHFSLRMARALAMQSTHPASLALARDAALVDGVDGGFEQCRELAGQGIEAIYQGRCYRLGSQAFVCGLSPEMTAPSFAFGNQTLVMFGDESGVLAGFALEDDVQDDAQPLLDFLRTQGKEIVLLSGDRQEAVAHVAAKLGVTQFYAQLSPDDKYAQVKRLQQAGARVAMVGDGMNDGPVLSLADVSVAMGQGAPISQTRSDMVLASNRLLDLRAAITLSRKGMRLIRENLLWALVYNLAAVPAAVFGVLEPWHAALGMSASSLIVVLNSLRIFWGAPTLEERRPETQLNADPSAAQPALS